jgi:acetylornithine deacetylase/succinyl-diaminopimelate desuccinylase-like protein
MSDYRASALHYAQDHRDRFLAEFKDFVSIASVSTDPQRKPEMEKAAEWVAGQLRELGLAGVEIYPTKGHPVVYGESLSAGPKVPTVLVYGHYDVQPPEPLGFGIATPLHPNCGGKTCMLAGQQI